jgi:CDP-glucose 4,6-dehydratase
MNPGFWAGRKVLVTGHTGFKGAWLCLSLQRAGAKVVGYALAPPTQPNLFEAAEVAELVESIRGDVRDLAQLTDVIRREAPEIVFHFAAQSVVRASYDDPIETYSTNVVGTATVFQAIRNVAGSRTVVNVTTDKVYRNHEWVWGYRENDELGGHDPYSNSKACAELVTQAFRDSFFPTAKLEQHGVAIAAARAGNVIGGGDWTADQLIPDVVRAFSAHEPVLIRQPKSVRPWQHVLDCLSGYVLLAERLHATPRDVSGAWNFGPELADARPVSWLVDALVQHWGGSASWKLDAGAHPHEAQLLRLDCSKAGKTLGWRPRLALADALSWTADWYKSHLAGRAARSLCLDQIDRYAGLGG